MKVQNKQKKIIKTESKKKNYRG